MTDIAEPPSQPRDLDKVIVRFAGDSGDGMQLTGDRFTSASALLGNDMATLPDFPAEIRAPQGTIAGVSAFQVQISNHEITTPGDAPNVLVAMNPAALMKDLERLEGGGTLIVNVDAFDERNLAKCGYTENPLTDGSLKQYVVIEVPMSSLAKEVAKDIDVKPRDAERSKNFFALGLISWMYTRPLEPTLEWIEQKFGARDTIVAVNKAALHAGHAFGETAELSEQYQIRPAKLPAGTYTSINGNTALSWGLIAASYQAKVPLFLGSYPITPATDILHELAKHKSFGVRTFQAEDEIAAIGAALGASYGGHIAVTTTSGPGLALKGETMGLAVSLELPLVIVDVQRGGPSTGLPTKTEASDLLMAMYGRHGEAPMPIVAAKSPSHCFHAAIEAVRLAVTYRTPVILLSDGYLANGTTPWRIPSVESLPDINIEYATHANHTNADGEEVFWPYLRDENLARPWAVPGTPELMHRIGGLEKEDGSGNVSYSPENHRRMTEIRQERIAKIADDIPLVEVEGDADANICVLGWGSTWGAISAAVRRKRRGGDKVAHVHLTHLNPFPKNLGEVLKSFERVIVPELNLGQLSMLVRAEFLVDAESVTKVMGHPFTAGELEAMLTRALAGEEL
ncbi:MAG: 2-oxoacid:acceptor oxidoreductase subunit alpha [Acidimicrobiales bacterium]